MDFETILILSAVIELITLICFFVLCANVSTIKKKLSPTSNFGASFNFYCAVGEYERAKELLFDEIRKEEFFDTAFWSLSSDKEHCQGVIKKRYGKYFETLNINLDFDKVNTFISSF